MSQPASAGQTLIFDPPVKSDDAPHVVLVSGDEEYRSEETMPMLGKILSQRHGMRCTVLFAFDETGSYLDSNNSSGIRGWEALDDADLMIIGTRFRNPNADDARHITKFIDAGKPIIGIRTSTHAFNGQGKFGGGETKLSYKDFGLKILGETWVSHHGRHKGQGGRSVITDAGRDSPIMNGVGPFFMPTDIYGVIHLTDADQVLALGEVTASLDPASPAIEGKKNDPPQPLAWLHSYVSPNGTKGLSFCTTAGGSVDFLDPDLRRLIVNAAYYLLDREVPKRANIEFVDPFEPTFYGFIREKNYYSDLNLQPEEYGLGKALPKRPQPKGTPDWPNRAAILDPNEPAMKLTAAVDSRQSAGTGISIPGGAKIAAVGGSLAERMNLFGHFETRLHMRTKDAPVTFRNFGWPADEVANQQRPGNYTKIDDPFLIYDANLLLCFFGFNESYTGADDASIKQFIDNYAKWIDGKQEQLSGDTRFVLVSPVAFESTGSPVQPDGVAENKRLAAYTQAIAKFAERRGLPFIDLFTESQRAFAAESGAQYTINGIHLNEQGDLLLASLLDKAIFGASAQSIQTGQAEYERLREAINDKSWFHLQDYRMLNGWYVYGGRRTWDTETFPKEFGKIREMVVVRDQYCWDLAAGKSVADHPDDSKTGDVFIPDTMFGSRDDNFRKYREPKTLKYPTPEESIAQMTVPKGFQVELFASEREFPELANPTQIDFDNQGRLWVSCMVNYPQWLPGAAKPNDRLLIFEDSNGDGKADKCTPFYDKLICPTGFEFWNGGVLVVDEPRILFLKDTDGDDRADLVVQLLDGIATDDTHHTMGAWEFSHSGRLHMLEGVSMSTTLETPYGPFRNKGPSGCYVWDLHSMQLQHFRTPGYGNPWCLVFDQYNNGIIGDGTGANHHWTSLLSGAAVRSRRGMTPVFNNEGMRPAVGNDYLTTRQFPEEMQSDFVYGCVINMHGMPRFRIKDEDNGPAIIGERIEDLLSSTDMFFRPVDPKIGPDGTMWFGDWCNALIGHMQYSQRDPNRDHKHGRVYRLVYKGKDLLKPVTQADKTVTQLLDQLTAYEPRTRYRARRELFARPKDQVLPAVAKWAADKSEPLHLCEAMWVSEAFRELDLKVVDRIMACDDYRARAAAVHSVSDEFRRVPDVIDRLAAAVNDAHPRVRLEAVRGASFLHELGGDAGLRGTEIAASVVNHPADKWNDYVLEHTLQALAPAWQTAKKEQGDQFLASSTEAARDAIDAYEQSTGPGRAAYLPLKKAVDVDLPQNVRNRAIVDLVNARGGSAKRGQAVYKRVCANCHIHGKMGKKFGPELSLVGNRMTRKKVIESILWPNEDISKGYETIQLL
ncbi:MAG: PVC-type heme-binding CxxCH protein, partial [Planctomycetota bacterium]